MPPSISRFQFSAFLFRVLVMGYPRGFRARFATQMQEDFRDMLVANASRGSWLGRISSWRRVLSDLTASVPRERLNALRPGRGRRPRYANRPGDRWILSVLRDARHAVRGLAKAPGFASIAVVTLALGIGANTAMFTLVNGILLTPPPVQDPEGVVAVWQHHRQSDNTKNSIAPATFRDFKTQSTVFDGLAAYYHDGMTVTGDERVPEQIQIGRVLPGFFAVLGTDPALGRRFREEEAQPGNHRVTILSGEYWSRRFGADSSVLGGTITLNRVDYEIVGVMPPGIDFSFEASLWIPIAFDEARWNNRGSHYLAAVGRLAPGVTLDDARNELEIIAARLGMEYPEQNEGWGVTVLSLHDDLVGHLRPALMLLQGAVLLVLLIACVNVANLQLARGSSRQGEFAIRTALGAGRGLLIRFLLTESLLLAGLGAVLGLAFAWGATDAVMAFAPGNVIDLRSVQLDRDVLTFTALVAAVTGVVFGLTPALQCSRTDLGNTLKDGRGTTGSGRRLRETLVVVEVGLSLILLVGAGLLINSFARLVNMDSGIDPENALTVRVWIPANVYSEAIERATFFQRLHDAVREVPGVESAALASLLPVTGEQGW